MTRRTIAVALALSLMLVGAAARGDARSDARARKIFREAEVHFNLQEFEKALSLYKQAYKLKPLPGFLFNIGQCQRYLGQYQEALFSYRIYLARMKDPPNRAQVEGLIKETEGLFARQQAGENPEPPKPPLRAVEPQEPDRPIEPEPEPDPNSFENRGPRALPVWVGISVTAGLLAAGVVTGQMAHSRAEEYADEATSVPRRRDLKDSGESLRTASIVGFSLAGASAIATTVYYLLVYEPARRAWRERRTLTLSPSPGGLTLSGAF